MRIPDRREILDYVEGSAGQDAEVQKRILNLLASSPVMREQMAELKRDLYLVSTQVPEYAPQAAFASEISKLSQAWLQLAYARRFSMKHFYRTREFYTLLGFLGAAVLLLCLFLWGRT